MLETKCAKFFSIFIFFLSVKSTRLAGGEKLGNLSNRVVSIIRIITKEQLEVQLRIVLLKQVLVIFLVSTSTE